MANPLACSVACASISLLLRPDDAGQPWWRRRVERIERVLQEHLAPANGLPGVADVRVLGAIGVVHLERPLDNAKVSRTCLELGVWLRPFGTLLYTMPPFVSDDAHLVKIASAMTYIAERAAEHEAV